MSSDGYRLDRSPLTRRELDEACLVAVRGFYTDPFFLYLSPKPTQRQRGLFLFFRTAVRHIGPGGVIVTVRNERNAIVGLSVWVAPGGYPQSIPTQLAQIPGSLRALYRRPRALVDGGKYLEAIAKAHPKDKHWYLYLLVADPETQRRGVGSMLLNDRLPHVDDEHVGAYLETQKDENLGYYRRFGFELVKPVAPVENGPPVYTMWRPPR
jgi:ribosomal protein S18 acetylase RimI-like enzyme